MTIITTWNLAAERMFDYTEADAKGQHITLIVPEDKTEEEAFIVGKILQGKESNIMKHCEERKRTAGSCVRDVIAYFS